MRKRYKKAWRVILHKGLFMKAKKTRYLIPLFILAILITFYFASHSSSSSAKQITEKSIQETAKESSIEESEEEIEEEVVEEPAADEPIEEPVEENLDSEEENINYQQTDNTSIDYSYNDELYNNIEVSVEIQDIIDGRQKIVVYIKNNNKNYAFSGTINFKAFSINNDILCLDYIYPDDIPPGIKTWAILWGKPGLYNSYSATISEANFREVTTASNIDYEEIGINGVFVFIYTTSTNCSELQQIVDVYKNDRFKSRKVFELDFFNDRKQALDAFTNADGVGFGMMLPVATYNYNANIGLDELNCYFEE